MPAGISWADYDNDGYLGPVARPAARHRDETNILLHNNGDGTWTPVDDAMTSDLDRWEGPAWGDYDNDGFLDVWFCNVLGANALFHNRAHANGNANHWIKFEPGGHGFQSDLRSAPRCGSRRPLAARRFWQMREISGSGFAGDDPPAHFGLGDATNVDLVRIEWPSGLVQEFQNVPVKQTLKVTEHQAGVTNAPTLTATRSAEGAVQLTLTGQTNLLYVFEGSTNLVQWTKLGVRTNLTGTVEFTDTWAAKYPQRFYRGVAP